MIPQLTLIGMPNVGKTAIFNKLTGSHQRVANFAGVTVEKKTGWVLEKNEQTKKEQKIFEVIDLPGIYSLDATTLDERVTKDFLLKSLKSPHSNSDLILVLDATNLEKSLFLALQLKKLGFHFTIVLNLMDEAKKRGLRLNLDLFRSKMEVPIIPVSAATGEGISDLISFLKTKHCVQKNNDLADNPSSFLDSKREVPKVDVSVISQKFLRSPDFISSLFKDVDHILKEIIISPLAPDSLSERVDKYVLHPVWGFVILISALLIIFQLLFSWASPLQDLLEFFLDGLKSFFSSGLSSLPWLRSLVVDGILSGVGGVLVFLPQIVILFFFIFFLEDVGYLGRVTFLMDSFMRKLGLPGKAVIPLLSSHACAIPGILSTRVINNEKERLTTMMVIPLITCSARLPVYAILVAAIVPNHLVFNIPGLRLPGVVLFLLYLTGFVFSLIVSYVLKRLLPSSSPSMLLMELPPYRIPRLKNIYLSIRNNASLFLRKAGGIILLVSLIIWFLVSFPGGTGETSIDHSYAAKIGQFLEPLFAPLGFDWRITTALIPSMGAREVVVSALSLVLSVEGESTSQMTEALVSQFGLGSLAALLVWFIFAPQCISTFAVLKRETNSLKWPMLMLAYTFTLAYVFSYLTRQVIMILF